MSYTYHRCEQMEECSKRPCYDDFEIMIYEHFDDVWWFECRHKNGHQMVLEISHCSYCGLHLVPDTQGQSDRARIEELEAQIEDMGWAALERSEREE